MAIIANVCGLSARAEHVFVDVVPLLPPPTISLVSIYEPCSYNPKSTGPRLRVRLFLCPRFFAFKRTRWMCVVVLQITPWLCSSLAPQHLSKGYLMSWGIFLKKWYSCGQVFPPFIPMSQKKKLMLASTLPSMTQKTLSFSGELSFFSFFEWANFSPKVYFTVAFSVQRNWRKCYLQ